jgi:predicted ATPase
VDYVYREAVKETANQQRAHFFGKLLNVPASAAPIYRSSTDLWDAAAPQLREKRRILILDELPYSAEADSAMLSALQLARAFS